MVLDSKTRFLLREVRESLNPDGVREAFDDSTVLEGCVLEGYTFGRLLGVGSSGTVFEAQGPDGVDCAVKVLLESSGERADQLSLFRREVGIGQAIDHPAVLKTLDAHIRGNACFLFMERVVGSTLRDALGEPLSRDVFLALFRPLSEGLQAAHLQGVVHRDLKPENVMIGSDGGVKILDFGLASWTRARSLTRTTQFKGTISYCAPEQVTESKSASCACDQFALGLVCFEGLTGRLPYDLDEENPLLNLMQRVNQPAMKLREVEPAFSEETQAVLEKMLDREPRKRYSDVQLAFACLAQSLRAGGGTL